MILSIAFNLPDPEHSPLTRYVLATGYLAAALCWFKAGLRARAAHNKCSERWWMLGALLFFFLAINKAFDWRVRCEMYIRMIANASGWYEQREPVQFFLAIILPVVAGLFILALLWAKARPFVRSHPFALVGWFLLFLYLALRQAQEWKPAVHWLDAVKYYQWRLVLEVAGIGLGTWAAILPQKEKN